MKKGGIYFKPHAISRFWLRRLCEVALLSCFTIILLYAWARFIPTGYQLPIGLSVSDLAANSSGVEQFNCLSVITNLNAVYVASCAGDVGDNGLLIARQSIE